MASSSSSSSSSSSTTSVSVTPRMRRFQEVAASFPTNFAAILRSCPPPLKRENEGILLAGSTHDRPNKVEVLLRVCPTGTTTTPVDSATTSSSSSCSSFSSSSPTTPATTTTTATTTATASATPAATSAFNILEFNNSREITIKDPNHFISTAKSSSANRKISKTFTFNAVFHQDSTMNEICSRSLEGILDSVIRGTDACLYSYGHARLGKTYTMLGVDDKQDLLGLVPCSIAWLFHSLDDLKRTTGTRYSVRVSALEVTGREVKDLLSESFASAPHCNPVDDMAGYRAPTPEHAALFLDAAIAARTISNDNERRNSHFLYTLHVHRHSFDGETSTNLHSRLHLLDLGSCHKHRESGHSMSLSELGNIFFALLNGKKFLPHSDSKLSQLLKRIFAPYPNMEICMLAHVSPAPKSYHQTLQISIPNGISPSDSTGSSSRNSDVEYSSSSEQSVDTVIFVGKKSSESTGTDAAPHKVPEKEIPPIAKIYPKNLSNLRKCESHGHESESQAKIHKKAPNDEAKCLSISERGQPQGREGGHPCYEEMEEEEEEVVTVMAAKGGEPLVENKLESNVEMWIDGPGKITSEQWIDGPQEFWTTPCAGIHGLKSPKIKKLYSALRHKHQQMSTKWAFPSTNTDNDGQQQQHQQQPQTQKQLQSQSLLTLQDEKYFVTASPDITAFHNFFEKHKQDLIHQKYSLPTDSKLSEDFEDFFPEGCCCKCHMKSGECKATPIKSPKHAHPSKENKHPKVKTDRAKCDATESIQDDRIADWVSSVQESGFSKFSQLLHSRKELIKSFQSPKNRHNLKPVLMEYFQNASPLATFDSPVLVQESSSPPPDYDSCLVTNHLDINENQMTSQNNRSQTQTDERGETKEEFHAKRKTITTTSSAATPQISRSSAKMCNGLNNKKSIADSVVRNMGPDGASRHDLHFEGHPAAPSGTEPCSFHESLRRHAKKSQFADGMNLASSRNYSSSETVFASSFDDDDDDDDDGDQHNERKRDGNIVDRLSSSARGIGRSTSKSFASPKRERCSLAMALLSCAAKYRKKADGTHSKSKPHPVASTFCLGHPSARIENSDASDAEAQDQRNAKRNLLVLHSVDKSGANVHRSVAQLPILNRPPR